jgi:hypothetical protein
VERGVALEQLSAATALAGRQRDPFTHEEHRGLLPAVGSGEVLLPGALGAYTGWKNLAKDFSN